MTKPKPLNKAIASWLILALAFGPTTTIAQVGSVITTPTTPMELPIEVEIELSPAGSLKQALLWKELVQLLENPYDPVVRRPGFGVAMPPVNMYPLNYNFLTGQPLRLRTSDGEVSWDQPGPMFDTTEVIPLDAFNSPTALRSAIGHLVACPNVAPGYQATTLPPTFCDGKPEGSLVVYNPGGHADVPPDGTVVAVAAFFDGMLHEFDPATGEYEEVVELATPVNEEDFFRDPADTAEVPAALRPLIGRRAAEILGKALFWDMQVGSDGVQSCASCHFNAGADNRTKGQLNPGTNSGDLTLLQVKPPNTDVVAADFPFHKRIDPEVVGDGTDPAIVVSDFNDVLSSMGVSQFKQFVDIPTPAGGIASAAFVQIPGNVRPLVPDIGTVMTDPVPANEGLRRVEPRNTPTFHGAAFNLENFWDSRARFVLNGGSVFGASDPQFHIFVNNGAANGALHGLPNPSEDSKELPLHQWAPEPGEDPVPARIKFSSLGSQSLGPPLSDFEMSFAGRNWAKIGKKLLQVGVTPLANQLVSTTDSVLGPASNQRTLFGGAVNQAGRRGLNLTYNQLIELAFARGLWRNNTQHFNGAACADPFDGYCLTLAAAPAVAGDTNQFRQREANFSLFFALSIQAYEALVIPDHTPADQFFDVNPNAGHGVGEPGDQAVLFPTLIRDLLDDGELNGTPGAFVTLIPDDPATPEYDGFGPDELFGFDLFAGANLTAALAPASAIDPVSLRNRNPQITNSLGQTIRVGSNPFTRSAKCMLCHLGPEQTDHSINIAHGLLKNDAEFEYPTPPAVPDPTTPATFPDGLLPAPEPSGSSRTVGGLILEEEVGEGMPQDAVEVEPRNLATLDDPATPWDDRVVSQQGHFAFGDQGVYNIGVRPTDEDIGRGGDDPFSWPLSLSALTLKNIGGPAFEPCDGPLDSCVMGGFDPSNLEATFEETGDGAFFPGTTHTLQSINPGFERGPITPQLPDYLAPWVNDLPAGELHPQIDEMAGMVPNTLTPPNGGPGIEFPEVLFGADLHCAAFNPAIFGMGPPNFGWGAPLQTEGPSLCPQHQSGVAGNFGFPVHGTWPVPNRVLRDGAFKAPPLRNVELTGPYFHTGSYLTLRQVVDFYFRGGDFPISNAENRDPHIVDLDEHAFSFGPSQGGNLLAAFDCSTDAPNDPAYPLVPGVGTNRCGSFSHLIGSFGDGLPDTAFLYDAYPDSNHPITPEPAFSSREAAIEDAKNSIVKFLLALTDPRVRRDRAPFDHPELFVPIDGAAPENTGGPPQLVSLSGVPCPVPGLNSGGDCFRQIPAAGAAGFATPVSSFLGVTKIPPGSPGFNCSSSAGPVSHFCSTIDP
jgi:hypothetical protein